MSASHQHGVCEECTTRLVAEFMRPNTGIIFGVEMVGRIEGLGDWRPTSLDNFECSPHNLILFERSHFEWRF